VSSAVAQHPELLRHRNEEKIALGIRKKLRLACGNAFLQRAAKSSDTRERVGRSRANRDHAVVIVNDPAHHASTLMRTGSGSCMSPRNGGSSVNSSSPGASICNVSMSKRMQSAMTTSERRSGPRVILRLQLR
jgi:hypothetical protein